ncbi:hypothetical protein LCGC14_2756520 [marine sediment metagenome]|uniref:Uncharacterized protein n=1 Tax=marine sediment metagenome TaxID=412755 RepID=A0A0F9BRW5_9ZZZZ
MSTRSSLFYTHDENCSIHFFFDVQQQAHYLEIVAGKCVPLAEPCHLCIRLPRVVEQVLDQWMQNAGLYKVKEKGGILNA